MVRGTEHADQDVVRNGVRTKDAHIPSALNDAVEGGSLLLPELLVQVFLPLARAA